MALDVVLIILGVLVLVGRAGFAMYVTGLVRSKNSAGTVTRAICDACVASLAFWAVGAAILFQLHNKYFAFDRSLIFGWVVERSFVSFFHLAVFLLATGVVVGAVAERFKFFPLCIASAVLAGLVLPVTCQWIWWGWLRYWGFLDIGGASGLHVAAGVFAAVAAIVVGPRNGKFNRDGSSTMIPGHSVPMASVGTLLLLVAWVAYLIGCAVHTPRELASLTPTSGTIAVNALMATAALNTVLSAAAAGFASLVLGQIRYGKPDVVLTLMGMLGGLVAISGGAGAISTPGAVLTGAVAGIAVPMTSVFIDLRLRVDDPTGLVAVHAIGGAWGTIAVALFAHLPTIADHGSQLLKQLVGVLVIAAFSAAVSGIVFAILKSTVGIRAREADEFDGLDLAEHDIGAYPDFQQTMIKSYHLREV